MEKKKRTILSLDTAEKTGYAIRVDGEPIQHGHTTFKSRDHKEKLYKFRMWLIDIISRYNVTEIVAEDIFYDPHKQSAFKSLGEMRGVLLEVCATMEVDIAFITPQQWKRHLCKDPYAKKADIQKRLDRIGFGWIESNDEADAVGILLAYKADLRRG